MPNIRVAKGTKYAYNPNVGVKTDCEAILQRFAQTGTVRYDAFAKIWREMKWHLYCAGRENQREAREFMEDVLRIAVQFCVPPSSFLVRAGAIYLLYGLYHFQLVNPKVKIRVTPEYWKMMIAFQEEAREQQHLDLNYIFQSLVIDRAFTFTSMIEWHYPTAKERDDVTVISENLKENCNAVEEIFSSSGLNQLSLIHDQYHKMKVVLNGEESVKPDTSLDIIHQDFIHGVYKTLRVHRDRQANIIQGVPHSKNKKNAETEFEERVEEIAEDDQISVKKGLKKKAFKTFKGYKVKASKIKTKGIKAKKVDISPKQETKVVKPNPHLRPWRTRNIQGRAAHINLFDKDELDTDSPKESTEVMKAVLSIPEDDIVVYKSTEASDSEKEEQEHSGRGKQPVKGKAKKKTSKKKSTRDSLDIKPYFDEESGSEREELGIKPGRIEIDLRSDSEKSDTKSPNRKRKSLQVRLKKELLDIDEDENSDHGLVKESVSNDFDLEGENNDLDIDLKPPKSKRKKGVKSTASRKKKNVLSKETIQNEDMDNIKVSEVGKPTAQQKLHQRLADRAKQSRLSKDKKKKK